MKFKVNGYEVEIKARDLSKDRASKNDTLQFLNDLSLLALDAKEYNEEQGYKAITEEANKYRKAFFDICKENGLYK